MNLRIGIDFDNTIANYDSVFEFAAKEKQFISQDWKGNKKELRNLLRNSVKGELKWQQLQGLVYGKYMHKAEAFPGLREFLFACKVRGVDLYIISHKTEYGHFDAEKISLRDEARKWLENNFQISKGKFGITRQNVFFHSTRLEKVQRIKELRCDYFIDDLVEVFEEELFPNDTKKILFDRSISNPEASIDISILKSWSQIRTFLLGELQKDEIRALIKNDLDFRDVEELEILKGNGNSRVYSFFADSSKYLLKIYPDIGTDPRPRLRNEFNVLTKLYGNFFPVPKPIKYDELLNWGIYEFINGNKVEEITDDNISIASGFCEKLLNFQKEYSISDFNLASEACLSGEEIEFQIESRLESLLKIQDTSLVLFLRDEFLPVFAERKNLYSMQSSLFSVSLNHDFWILSPSDFGFHNVIRTRDDGYYFIDFEYFGWDDPAKLISDFVWHPGMKLSMKMKRFWVERMSQLYTRDYTLRDRLVYYLPLIGLRWCLILLNEFRGDKIENRILADQNKSKIKEEIKSLQLQKSRKLLEEIVALNSKDLLQVGYSIG